MTQTKVLILAFVVALLLATPVRAQDVTSGNYLIGSCQITLRVIDNPNITLDKYEAWRDGYCRGIIEGVGAASPLVCSPQGVTFSQEYRIVTKYLQDHPERLNSHGAELVQEALVQAFPCSK
jgi:hypothetical protein